MIKNTADIKEVISSRMSTDAKLKNLWGRYVVDAKEIPIYKLPMKNKDSLRIHTPFFRDVVKVKTGYMGSSISVNYNPQDEISEIQERAVNTILRDFSIINNEKDENSSMVRDCAAMSRGYRLMYNKDGVVRIKNLKPYQVYVIEGEGSKYDPDQAMWYYKVDDLWIAEVYDRKEVSIYKETTGGEFQLHERMAHTFDAVPIIPFFNNEEMIAEPEDAIGLMDSYDRTLSNSANLIQASVDSFLLIQGENLDIDNDFLNMLSELRIALVKPSDNMSFVERNINDVHVMNNLKTLRDNIYAMSSSFDSYTDVGGGLPVIGYKQKTHGLELSCKETERKFQSSLYRQYELYFQWLKRWKNITLSHLDLEFTFTRSYPKNIQEEAATLAVLTTQVSRKDAYSLMSFIDNPDEWLERFDEEQDAYRSFLDTENTGIQLDDSEPTDNPEDRGSGQ